MLILTFAIASGLVWLVSVNIMTLKQYVKKAGKRPGVSLSHVSTLSFARKPVRPPNPTLIIDSETHAKVAGPQPTPRPVRIVVGVRPFKYDS